jgi:hypothetical protein
MHWLAGCNATWISFYERGLAAALHSGIALPAYFNERLQPALRTLLDAAVAARVVRPGIEADDLLRVVATLCRCAKNGRTAGGWPALRSEHANRHALKPDVDGP